MLLPASTSYTRQRALGADAAVNSSVFAFLRGPETVRQINTLSPQMELTEALRLVHTFGSIAPGSHQEYSVFMFDVNLNEKLKILKQFGIFDLMMHYETKLTNPETDFFHTKTC